MVQGTKYSVSVKSTLTFSVKKEIYNLIHYKCKGVMSSVVYIGLKTFEQSYRLTG